jgi:hypothetical protein
MSTQAISASDLGLYASWWSTYQHVKKAGHLYDLMFVRRTRLVMSSGLRYCYRFSVSRLSYLYTAVLLSCFILLVHAYYTAGELIWERRVFNGCDRGSIYPYLLVRRGTAFLLFCFLLFMHAYRTAGEQVGTQKLVFAFL